MLQGKAIPTNSLCDTLMREREKHMFPKLGKGELTIVLLNFGIFLHK